MDFVSLLTSLQRTNLATEIRDALFVFPLLESAHVVGFSVVFGTILVIDLRLLGVASRERPYLRMSSDILKWTWAAFTLAAVTGLLMFITNPVVYFRNFYFRTKFILLVLAALNVLVFELTAGRTADRWGEAPSAPRMGRAVATTSLMIWIAVIFAGRMIGFTTTRALAEPTPVDVNFEDLLQRGPVDRPAIPPGAPNR